MSRRSLRVKPPIKYLVRLDDDGHDLTLLPRLLGFLPVVTETGRKKERISMGENKQVTGTNCAHSRLIPVRKAKCTHRLSHITCSLLPNKTRSISTVDSKNIKNAKYEERDNEERKFKISRRRRKIGQANILVLGTQAESRGQGFVYSYGQSYV